MMQKGLVVYVAGTKEIAGEVDLDRELERAGCDPRWAVISAPDGAHPTPERAALELVRRGAAEVELASAVMAEGAMRVTQARHRIY